MRRFQVREMRTRAATVGVDVARFCFQVGLLLWAVIAFAATVLLARAVIHGGF